MVPCRTYLRGRMSLLYRIFRAATRSRGDRRWDLFIRGAGLVALLAIPVAVAFPRLAKGGDTDAFVAMAHEEFGVGLVPGSLFGYRQNFRISAGVAREVLEGGLEALGKALDRGLY